MQSSSVSSVKNICFISIFTAIIAVCAQISIPMPTGIPLTLQTFAVALAGIILGSKRGALSVTAYVLLGAIGIPVFTKFNGGFAVLFGATGGFILSFPLFALCAGIFTDLGENKKPLIKYCLIAAGIILGAIINYICGLLMFSAIISRSLTDAFFVCVLPFILTDIIKFILAGIIGVSVKKILMKNKIL